MTNCEDIQESLSLYSDDGLEHDERARCYQHLEVCPVCREHLVELQSLRRSLATLPRPAIPRDLAPSINRALVAEATEQKYRREATLVAGVCQWVWPRHDGCACSSAVVLV